MQRTSLLIAALTSGVGCATLAHAYASLRAAKRRCSALLQREEELMLVLEAERGKSPIRRDKQAALERELEGQQKAIMDLESTKEEVAAERCSLAVQVEDLKRAISHEKNEHANTLAERSEELQALHTRHDADMQALLGEKSCLEGRLADLEKKSFAALDGLRQKLSEEQGSLELMRQTLIKQEEDKTIAADAQQILSQSLAQARKETEKLKGEIKKLEMERVRLAAEIQSESDLRRSLEQKYEGSHAELKNLEMMLERAFDERQRHASALSSLFSSLQDARLEVAASVIGAADSAQNTIRLEEQLEQERADNLGLHNQLKDMAALRQQIQDLAKERDDALAQVADVQERDLRVIEGLMDDVAKADVSLKQFKDEAALREDALERARDAALKDGDALRAELEAAEQQRDAMVAERDEESDAKAHALADADHVSEELMYLHSETARQAEHQTELAKKHKNTVREINFLQEMLSKCRKKHEVDAKELEEVRLQVEAWKRMASTRAPHTDARHLQWFRQSLIGKKKCGALDAVEARALAAFESDADNIFRKTTASGHHDPEDQDSLLVEAFHDTILQRLRLSRDAHALADRAGIENSHPATA